LIESQVQQREDEEIENDINGWLSATEHGFLHRRLDN
jgi:hypothetical protein